MINMLVNSTNNANYGSTSSLQKSNQYNKKLGSLKTSTSPRRPFALGGNFGASFESDRNPASDSSRSSIGNQFSTANATNRPSRLSRIESNSYQPNMTRSRLGANENSSSYDSSLALQKRIQQQEMMRHEKERELERDREREAQRKQQSRDRELRELEILRERELRERERKERELKELELRERAEQRMRERDRDRDRDMFVNQYHDSAMPPIPQGLVNHSRVNKNYLLKMKKKFKNKISANLSGTKFEIGEWSRFDPKVWYHCLTQVSHFQFERLLRQSDAK